jgi:hypothetical protein
VPTVVSVLPPFVAYNYRALALLALSRFLIFFINENKEIAREICFPHNKEALAFA